MNRDRAHIRVCKDGGVEVSALRKDDVDSSLAAGGRRAYRRLRGFGSRFPLAHALRLRLMSRESIYARAYSAPEWGSVESASGCGSELGATKDIRRELPTLLARHSVHSMLDAPCGDWN